MRLIHVGTSPPRPNVKPYAAKGAGFKRTRPLGYARLASAVKTAMSRLADEVDA